MILIDKNLFQKLVRYLNSTFKKMIHVNNISLERADDTTIWDYANKHHLHLLTKDSDFNAIQTLKGFPPKIIWLRCGNVSTSYIVEMLQENSSEIIAFLEDSSTGIIEIR